MNFEDMEKNREEELKKKAEEEKQRRYDEHKQSFREAKRRSVVDMVGTQTVGLTSSETYISTAYPCVDEGSTDITILKCSIRHPLRFLDTHPSLGCTPSLKFPLNEMPLEIHGLVALKSGPKTIYHSFGTRKKKRSLLRRRKWLPES